MVELNEQAPAGAVIVGDISEIPTSASYIPMHTLEGLEDNKSVAAVYFLEDEYLLFLAESISRSPVAYSIQNRLKQKGKGVVRYVAKDELIKAVHSLFVAVENDNKLKNFEDSDIEKLTWQIFDDALISDASDVHIEAREGYADIFFRIYGHRRRYSTVTLQTAYSIAGVLYDVHADAASKDVKWRDDEPKDSVIDFRSKFGQRVQIRFASAPMYPKGCFQIVCRLLVMDSKRAPSLSGVGYSPTQLAAVEEMQIGAQGLLILVGPTNSGKSTSMQALVRNIITLRGPTIKLETIEDPVEYLIPGAVQMPVGPRSSFNALLKSTLRHDPDVLLVGEIRDHESAEAVKNIVLAGRKVLATLHVYEAMAAFSRLIELGLPRDVLFMRGFISGVIYQRLLPILCQGCCIDIEEAKSRGMITDSLNNRLTATTTQDEYKRLRFQNANGCAKCREKISGYGGRTICAEIVVPDDELIDAMRAGRQDDARKLWLAGKRLDEGWGVTALGHSMRLVVAGKVDPRDVESQVAVIKPIRTKNPSVIDVTEG